MSDLRLDLRFLSNLKTKKLMRHLGQVIENVAVVAGDHGVVCLIRFWSYVADHYQKGTLHGLREDDIEDIAEWRGERGAFASYLVNSGWLDRGSNGVLIVHDWREHQRFIFFAPERRQQSRKANDVRWQRKRGVNPDRTPDRTPEIQNQESPASASASASASEDQKIRADADASDLPSADQGGRGNGQDHQARKPRRRKEYPPEVLDLWEDYCNHIARVPAKKADTLRNIAARLKEGFTEQQLGDAIVRYEAECDRKKIPEDRRYHANNFFGKKEYLAGYLPEPEPDDDQEEAQIDV